jgi:hypothetical protein
LGGAYFNGFGLVCGAPTLVYPVGADCSSDEDCDTANCVDDRCAASTCMAPADCSCGLFDTRPYLFCTGAYTQSEAEAACQGAGLELVRVNKGTENGWLRSTATLRELGGAWLGGTDGATEGDWLWPDGAQFWQGDDTGAPVGSLYAAWAPDQPDNSGTTEHCQEQQEDSLWNDLSCDSTRTLLCEPP